MDAIAGLSEVTQAPRRLSAHVPMFRELMERSDLNHRDVVVYGVIAAYQMHGTEPTIADIAYTCGDHSREAKATKKRLRKLGELLLLRREQEAQKRVRFVLLGPNYDEREAEAVAQTGSDIDPVP